MSSNYYDTWVIVYLTANQLPQMIPWSKTSTYSKLTELIKYHEMTNYKSTNLDPSHKSHNAFDKYPTMHQCITEMCTHVHI